VDSVIVVVDVAKGVETQTRKLMEVCRMRHTPVMIFVNKLDREGRDPFEILDELEEELQITVRPLSWPIDMGGAIQGGCTTFTAIAWISISRASSGSPSRFGWM